MWDLVKPLMAGSMLRRAGVDRVRGGALPAWGFLVAGLPDGAVEQAQWRRERAQGGGGVLAAGAVQDPGEHLAPAGHAVLARDLETGAPPFRGGQGPAHQRQAVPLLLRQAGRQPPGPDVGAP